MTYPLPSNLSQYIDAMGKPTPDLYRWLKQLDAAGATTGGFAQASRQLTAGNGLTGGGDLTADRSFAVGAGTGIQVNADSIEVKYGSTADTAAQGNDSRIVGAAQTADLGSAAFADTTDFDAAGAATAAIASHVAATDPHPQYLTATEGNAAYQPLDSDLAAIAALATTSFGRSLLTQAAASNLRSTAGLVIGTDVQAYDAELAAIAGLTSAADRVPYFTGSGTAALATFTSAGRALIDDADATAQRTTLGLGTAAVQDYQTGTWTPTFAFSGDATGITYAAGTFGTYVKIGKFIFVTCTIILSNKGTATGNAQITGLPFISNTAKAGGGMVNYSGFTGLTGALLLALNIQTNEYISLRQTGATGAAFITDTACTNSTRVDFSLAYISAT